MTVWPGKPHPEQDQIGKDKAARFFSGLGRWICMATCRQDRWSPSCICKIQNSAYRSTQIPVKFSCLGGKVLAAIKRIAALDIGTRSVTGIIGDYGPDGFKLVASSTMEHRNRAMHDGQIQDIEEVAAVIIKVKEKLESKVKTQITNVAVAAAGRSLVTLRGQAKRTAKQPEEITRENILSLEIEAVQKAATYLLEQKDDNNYYCIDYVVTGYYIDGDRIVSLLGQKSADYAVDIVATFLPRIVVDSLDKALELSGLNMENLTLEPIAASNVVIPRDMRKLNLVLLDVGAGTSDIAISRNDSIFAYGMVPFAGDEITEKICKDLLVDFGIGEDIKRQLLVKSKIKFKNVLGMDQDIESSKILQNIDDIVASLASSIAEKVQELNDGPPDAMLCVGGGSLTPGLTEKLADKLGIDRMRVAVRGTDAVKEIVGKMTLKGPEYVTPIGIAFSAINHAGLKHCVVKVNDRQVRLFNLGRLTIKDALLAAGITSRKLMGRPGMSITYELNDEIKIIKGEPGIPAKISIAGIEKHMDDEIKDGDEIKIVYGSDGKSARSKLSDIIEKKPYFSFLYNDCVMGALPLISYNGKFEFSDPKIEDQCKIRIRRPESIYEVLTANGVFPSNYQVCPIHFMFNNMERSIEMRSHNVRLNGRDVSVEELVQQDDRIEIEKNTVALPRVMDLVDMYASGTIRLEFNGVEKEYNVGFADIECNGFPVTSDQLLSEHDTIVARAKTKLIFSDIFQFEDIDINGVKPWFVLKLNGAKAEFTDPIRNGDRLEIRLEPLLI